jgi:RNA polymerase sigma-70 factor (ECF subfamily)
MDFIAIERIDGTNAPMTDTTATETAAYAEPVSTLSEDICCTTEYVTASSSDIEGDSLFDAKTNITEKPRKKKTQGDIDREIVEKFYANQTPDAFASIWERFYYGVHSYAYRFIGDWERAADVVQDTFQKAWEKRAMYDPKKSVYSTWLYTITRNVALTQKQVAQKDRCIDVDVNDVFYSTIYNTNDNYAVNDEVYYMTESNGEISNNSFEDITQKIFDVSMGELGVMDPLFQEIMDMKNVQGLTLREIASKMGMTESKVKNIYYKNKEILSERIRSKYGDLYSVYREANHDKDEKEFVYG